MTILNYRPWSLALAGWIVSVAVQAQPTIYGKVTDTSGAGIPDASILVLDSAGRSVMVFSFTDAEGKYAIKIQETTRVRMTCSAMGFAEASFSLSLKDRPQEHNIVLQERPLELQEVIVRADQPVLQKKDTTVFDVSSFSDGTEDVVEDLLKKIPGLTVGEDGTISVNGKEVEKVMIEGDDLFDKGYRVLTKNMPAQPVNKVEVLQRYSDNRLLRGVEESDKVALNLTLHEDAKSQWFTHVNGGYGIKERHSLSANAFNFSKKNKYYLIGGGNNIGDDATGDIEHLFNPSYVDDVTTLEDKTPSGQLIDLTTLNLDFKKSRTNLNNDKLISLNGIIRPTEKSRLKGIAFFNHDTRTFRQSTTETFNAINTGFTNTEDHRWNHRHLDGFGRMEFTHDNKVNQVFKSISSFQQSDGNTENRLAFNEADAAESLETSRTRFDQQLSVTRKPAENVVWILKGRYIDDTQPQHYHTDQFFFADLFPGAPDANAVRQQLKRKTRYAGAGVSLLKRGNNNDLLEIDAQNEIHNVRFLSHFALLDDGVMISQPGGYQNDLHYFSNDAHVAAQYTKWLKKFSLTGGLALHALYNRIREAENDGSQYPLFLNPSIGISWRPGDHQKLSGSYTFNTTNAALPDVYRGWTLTGFRSFARGTGTFNQPNASTSTLHYQNGSFAKDFSFYVFAFHTRSHSFLSGRNVITQNYALTERLLLRNRDMMSIHFGADRFLSAISSNLKFDVSYSQARYKNIVNDAVRDIHTTGTVASVEIRSGFLGLFNFHSGTRWTFSAVQSPIRNRFFNQNTFLDLVFRLRQQILFQLQFEHYYFGSAGPENEYVFVDAQWRYTIKPNKLSLMLRANNLANVDAFTSVSLSDISVSTTSYALMPRFVLLTAEYRF